MGFSAEWRDGDGQAGVTITAEGISWWYTPNGDGGRFGGVGQSQTFAEYLENGPIGPAPPEGVIAGLDAALAAAGHLTSGPRKLKTADELLRAARAKKGAKEDVSDLEAYDRWLREKSGE